MKKTITIIAKIMVIIATCEFLIMLLFAALPPFHNEWLEASLDSLLLTILSCYPLLRFVIQPMMRDFNFEATERLRTEMASNLNTLYQNMLEGVVVQNASGEIVFHNQTALNILGLTEDQIMGRTSADPKWRTITEDGKDFPGQDHPAMVALNTGQKIEQKIMGVYKPNGELRWISINAAPIFDEVTKKPIRVLTTFQDITERKKLIDDLETQKVRIQIATQSRELGIWDWDIKNNILYWDDSMFKLYGVDKQSTPDAFLAFQESVLPEDAERIKKELDVTFSERKDFFSEFKVKKSDGEIRDLKTASKATYSADGQPLRLIGINWDVTEEKKQELRLLQSSKMSSLGEMSAGIAHEINNPLTIISGKTRQIFRQIQEQPINLMEVTESLEVINKTCHRVAIIIKGLRTFARDKSNDPFQVVTCKNLMDETLSFCYSRFISHNVQFEISEIPDLEFECHPTQISQVLLNLLNNAFDAIQENAEKKIELIIHQEDDFVVFRVCDNGPGIPPAERHKIMQPFYTTKQAGHGTGLGLSIAKGIMQTHHGELTLDPDSTKTCFIAKVPLKQPAQSNHQKQSSEAA